MCDIIEVSPPTFGRLFSKFFKCLFFSDIDHGGDQMREVLLHGSTSGGRVMITQCCQDFRVFCAATRGVFVATDCGMHHPDGGQFGAHFPEGFNDVLNSGVARRRCNGKVELPIGLL